MKLKILIYTIQENIDDWILKIEENFKINIRYKTYNGIVLENNMIKVILKTEISESIRGYRWNYVILDAPIKRKILDFWIKPKIITENYTKNFEKNRVGMAPT